MILKVCGITNQEDADAAVAAGANAIGFNFYAPSPRYITPEHAGSISTPLGVRRVGVFVNESRARVEEVARIAALDTAQLHGEEAPKDYPEGVAVWKGEQVREGFDLAGFARLPVEALVLDGPAGALRGGSGKSFDWSIVGQVFGPAAGLPPGVRPAEAGRAAQQGCPTILAGGLDASNVARAIEAAHPWGVDACSRIESFPGRKDHAKMRAFLEAAKAALCT
jgi:phosphoribosylanthranilate isomerase